MSQISQDDVSTVERGSEHSLVLPVILLILAVVYDLSPVDVIPDVPVAGYIDDFFITVTAFLNFFQKWLEGSSLVLAAIVQWLKWGVVFLGVMAVSLVGLAVYGIVKLISAL